MLIYELVAVEESHPLFLSVYKRDHEALLQQTRRISLSLELARSLSLSLSLSINQRENDGGSGEREEGVVAGDGAPPQGVRVGGEGQLRCPLPLHIFQKVTFRHSRNFRI